MSIVNNLKKIKETLLSLLVLIAVSKTKPIASILEAYQTGHKVFGENKIQELVDKQKQLPEDIEWHMIGHVQRNKVKYIAEFVTLIHAVDSYKLLVEINKQAAKHQRKINCLLQIKIATEDAKFGMTALEATEILKENNVNKLHFINIVGLMGMATFTDNQSQLQEEFEYLKSTFDVLNTRYPELEIISMGMSGDYKLAIDAGSTMVRLGSSIFGERNYSIIN